MGDDLTPERLAEIRQVEAEGYGLLNADIGEWSMAAICDLLAAYDAARDSHDAAIEANGALTTQLNSLRDDLDAAQARIADLERQLAEARATEWRPMETAPRDGTKVDVVQGGRRVVNVYWSDVEETWCRDGDYGPEEPSPLPIVPKPAGWLPLPEVAT